MKFVVLCEPPYTERYVRWCEGTADKLIVYLLLDHINKSNDIKNAIEEINKKPKNKGIFVSFIYSIYHPDREFGEEIEPNTYNNFRQESFYQAGKVHFMDIKEIFDLYSKFKIENITRHSLNEVYDKPHRFIESDEFIIIARKDIE